MLSVSAKPQISYSWMFPSVLCYISLVSRRCSSSLVRLASGKHHVWLKWLLRMENLELLWKVAAFVVGKPAGKSLQETFRGFSGLTRAPHVLLAVINPPLMMKQAPIEHLRQDACTKMESKQKNMEERRQFSNYCCSWDETPTVCNHLWAKSLSFHHIYNRCDMFLHVYSIFFWAEFWLLHNSHDSFGFPSSWVAASSSSLRHTRRWSGVKPGWTTTHAL